MPTSGPMGESRHSDDAAVPVTGLRAFAARLRVAVEGPEGPPIAWTLRGYRPDQLPRDLISGLTVAALIVPLSIGYAGVAGLPPEVGLYASFAPLLAYAAFGSARRLIVGPDASTAALIAATILPLAAASDERVRLAGVLALMVAGIFLAMRLGRMGFLADFLSRPILVGYMTGVGLTVAAGQVEKILGGPAIADGLGVLARIDWASSNIAAVVEAVGIAVRGSGAELASIAIGGGVALAMLLGRRFAPLLPMALIAMVVSLVLSAVLDLQSYGVRILGPVASGLPPIGIPTVSPTEMLALLPGALGLAILSFADTAATGRTFARLAGERTDANRELVALAAADAAGGLTGGYPISSSPSRTGAALNSGSTSQMTGLVAAATVIVVLVLLTGPLAYLPIPALGGVILVSVLGLIDIGSIREIWALKRSEGIIALIALGGVIIYGTLVGVGVAVLLAALNIVRRSAWPQIVEEGRLADGTWRDLTRRADSRPVAGVIALRFTGPIFFANAAALDVRVRTLINERPTTRAIVLDLAATADIDLTAGDAIRSLDAELTGHGRRLAVAQPVGRVRDELRAYGLEHLMAPTAGTYGSVDAAIMGLGLDPDVLETDVPSAVAAPVPTLTVDEVFGPQGSPNRVLVTVLGGGIAIIAAALLVGAILGRLGEGSAAGPATVPNLIGLPLDRARTAAGDSGFDLEPPSYVRRDDQPEGTVVDQDPPPGTVADRGTGILPVVSTGRQLVVVPDVVGLSEGSAIARLTSAGLTVRRGASVEDPGVPAGDVVATDPVAGTSVATGTSVTYAVSSGAGSDSAPASPSEVPSPTELPSPAASPTELPSPAASPNASASP
jgi:high affinity sulfate transporter 1